MRWRCPILHPRPENARRQRGAQADAGEVGHEPAARVVEGADVVRRHAAHCIRAALVRSKVSIGPVPVRIEGESPAWRRRLPEDTTDEAVPAERLSARRAAAAPRRFRRSCATSTRVREEMKAAGAWVFAAGSTPPSTATVVRVKDGDVLMTDGPFAEGKEHIGGFSIVKAADLDAALEWGRKLARATTLRSRSGRSRSTALMPECRTFDRGDRTCVPRGVRPRGGRAGPRLRRHRHRRGGGPGRVHGGGAALAVERTAAEPGGMDHHDRAQPGDRSAAPRGVARRPPRPGGAAARRYATEPRRRTPCTTIGCA